MTQTQIKAQFCAQTARVHVIVFKTIFLFFTVNKNCHILPHFCGSICSEKV